MTLGMLHCKRPGCKNMAAKGQSYCSKQCAPYSHLTGPGPETKKKGKK